jgi:hypothetical protein
MNIWNERLANGIWWDVDRHHPSRPSSDVPVSRTLKVRSTPKSPERSVLHGIDQLHLNWNVRIPWDTAEEFNAQLTANERGAVDLVTPLEANRMSIFW